MSLHLCTPSRRRCERCGRLELFDDEIETWRIATDDGNRRVGDPYCIHEWDINGKFAPFSGET